MGCFGELMEVDFGWTKVGMVQKTLRTDWVHRFCGLITAPCVMDMVGVPPGLEK